MATTASGRRALVIGLAVALTVGVATAGVVVLTNRPPAPVLARPVAGTPQLPPKKDVLPAMAAWGTPIDPAVLAA